MKMTLQDEVQFLFQWMMQNLIVNILINKVSATVKNNSVKATEFCINQMAILVILLAL